MSELYEDVLMRYLKTLEGLQQSGFKVNNEMNDVVKKLHTMLGFKKEESNDLKVFLFEKYPHLIEDLHLKDKSVNELAIELITRAYLKV
ncbi:hypothetical protein [Halobacillus litoralis]|uniref:hypothetical protein n=1 Tax=Halobacillus litoralis TaxID=45668 RepID=UPI001CD55DFC|nr:hypothetical protein [Halobacillus litoralis]MCA1021634.1 hypothetical protein [Halobacillus litoralis]